MLKEAGKYSKIRSKSCEGDRNFSSTILKKEYWLKSEEREKSIMQV